MAKKITINIEVIDNGYNIQVKEGREIIGKKYFDFNFTKKGLEEYVKDCKKKHRA